MSKKKKMKLGKYITKLSFEVIKIAVSKLYRCIKERV